MTEALHMKWLAKIHNSKETGCMKSLTKAAN